MTCQTFDHLPDIETSNANDIKMSFLFAQKDCSRDKKIFNDTVYTVKSMKLFWEDIDRDDLKLLRDVIVHWVIFLFYDVQCC